MLPDFHARMAARIFAPRTIENVGSSWHKRFLFPTSPCPGDDDHFVPIASPAPLATKLLKV